MPLDIAPQWHHHDGEPRGPRPRRLPDWQPRLFAFLEARRRRPFAWGTADSTALVVDAVEAMTGRRIFAPTWRTATEATAGLLAQGGIVGLWSRHFGEPMAGQGARLGDVLTVGDEARSKSAICVDDGRLCLPMRDGLVVMPLSLGQLCWRVG